MSALDALTAATLRVRLTALPRSRALVLALTAPLFLACSESSAPEDKTVASLQVAGGNGQQRAAGDVLSESLAVKALNSRGRAVVGADVVWALGSSGGSLNPQVTTTDSAGIARSSLTLGTTPGDYVVVAHSGDHSVAFSAKAVVGPPRTIAHSGDNQTGPVATQLPTALEITARDAVGNLVNGAAVTWSVIAGNGSLSVANSTTENGSAKAYWILGTTAGVQRVRATVGDQTVTFSAFAVAGPPSALTLVSGASQTGTVAQMLSAPVTVRVTDAYGNPVVGWAVFWHEGLVGNTALRDIRYSDENGQSSFAGPLGDKAGTYEIRAVVSETGQTVQVSAIAAPDTPSRFKVSAAGFFLTAPRELRGEAVEFDSIGVNITSFDRFDNPTGPMTVSLSPTLGTNTSDSTVTTDASGNATVLWIMRGTDDFNVSITVRLLVSLPGLYTWTLSAASSHVPMQRVEIAPDTAYSVASSGSMPPGRAIFNAYFRDTYGHKMPPALPTATCNYSITPPATYQVVGRFGEVDAWSAQPGTYTLTVTCSNGFTDSATMIVQ